MTTTPTRGSKRVNLVTADETAPLARQTAAALAREPLQVKVIASDELPGEGVHVLLDDPSLPPALERLMQRSEERSVLGETVMVVEDATRGGLLLADGFRDVVGADSAGRAAMQAHIGGAPVVLERVRVELEERVLPALVTEMRLRADEVQRLLRECVELMSSTDLLTRRLRKFERMARRQAVDEARVASGRLETFAEQLAEVRRPRLHRLKRFPESRLSRTAFGTGEPRIKKKHRTSVPDSLAWLENADLLGSLSAGERAELDAIGRDGKRTPVAAFRSCVALLDRVRADKLAHIQRLHQDINPREAVASWLDESHGFGVLAPGFAMPAHLARLIKNHIHPPPEVYTTWCLELATMRPVMTSQVLGLIAKELLPSSLSVRRAPSQPQLNQGKEQSP